jgi:hypothetical protein
VFVLLKKQVRFELCKYISLSLEVFGGEKKKYSIFTLSTTIRTASQCSEFGPDPYDEAVPMKYLLPLPFR